MIKNKTVFISNVSLADAQMQARMQGYQVVGQSSQPGKHIVFVRPTNAVRMV